MTRTTMTPETYCPHWAALLWARLELYRAKGEGYGPGFRYDVAQFSAASQKLRGETWSLETVRKSKAAAKLWAEGGKPVFEHAIPLKVLFKMMLDAKNVDEMAAIVQKYHGAWHITREEDQLLNKAGLRHKMPSDWDGEKIRARYDAVGIEF